MLVVSAVLFARKITNVLVDFHLLAFWFSRSQRHALCWEQLSACLLGAFPELMTKQRVQNERLCPSASPLSTRSSQQPWVESEGTSPFLFLPIQDDKTRMLYMLVLSILNHHLFLLLYLTHFLCNSDWTSPLSHTTCSFTKDYWQPSCLHIVGLLGICDFLGIGKGRWIPNSQTWTLSPSILGSPAWIIGCMQSHLHVGDWAHPSQWLNPHGKIWFRRLKTQIWQIFLELVPQSLKTIERKKKRFCFEVGGAILSNDASRFQGSRFLDLTCQ